jgi:hypothetical protein
MPPSSVIQSCVVHKLYELEFRRKISCLLSGWKVSRSRVQPAIRCVSYNTLKIEALQLSAGLVHTLTVR